MMKYQLISRRDKVSVPVICLYNQSMAVGIFPESQNLLFLRHTNDLLTLSPNPYFLQKMVILLFYIQRSNVSKFD